MTMIAALFVIGAVFLGMEILLPGGILGVFAGIALVGGIVLAFLDFGLAGGAVALIVALVSVSCCISKLRFCPRRRRENDFS